MDFKPAPLQRQERLKSSGGAMTMDAMIANGPKMLRFKHLERHTWHAALPLLLTLAGCGGTAPPQSASSSPLPVTYPTLNNPGSDPYAANAASYGYYRSADGTLRTPTQQNSVTIGYDPATATYSLSGTASWSGAKINQSFAPKDAVAGSPGTYDKTTQAADRTDVSRLIIGTPLTLTYTNWGKWEFGATVGPEQNFDTVFFTYGIATRATDMPRTGTASYNLSIVGGSSVSMTGYGALSADFSTQRVDVSLTPQNNYGRGSAPSTIATLTGNGAITATDGRYGFLVPLSGSGFTGTFSGQFYGPAAAEVGGAFSFGKNDIGGGPYAGIALGKKN